MYACETCPVAEAIDGLCPENYRAWRLFESCHTRFLVDTGALGAALMRLTADEPVHEFADLMTRLSILYQAYFPPKRGRDGA